MKAWIDQENCIGSQHCVRLAPSVFAMKDGKAYVQENGTIVGEGPDALGKIPEEHLDAVMAAADKCEGECIFLEIDD
jgi:ferredoxin